MTEPEIYQTLTGIFRDVFSDDTIELSAETNADDIPEWDSFNHINIIVTAEATFGVKFNSSDVERLKNVGEFVGLIAARLAKKRG